MRALISADRKSTSKNVSKVHNCSLCEPGYLDEISQLGNSRWHSTFCKP